MTLNAFQAINDRIRASEREINSLKSRLSVISRGAQVVVTSAAHGLLSAIHSDTVAAGPTRGDLIAANSDPKWARLSKGMSGQFLKMLDADDPGWSNLPAIPIPGGSPFFIPFGSETVDGHAFNNTSGDVAFEPFGNVIRLLDGNAYTQFDPYYYALEVILGSSDVGLTAMARLWDVTDAGAILVTTVETNSITPVRLRSPYFRLPLAEHEYYVEFGGDDTITATCYDAGLWVGDTRLSAGTDGVPRDPPILNSAGVTEDEDDATSLTFAATIDAGTNKCLLVGVMHRTSGSVDIDSVEYNGIGMDTVIEHVEGDVHISIFALFDPPEGTFDVVISCAASGGIVGIAVPLDNVDQVVPFGNTYEAANTGASFSDNLTASADYLVLDLIGGPDDGSGATPTADMGQTELSVSGIVGVARGAMSSQVGIGTTPMGWAVRSEVWSHVLVAVQGLPT